MFFINSLVHSSILQRVLETSEGAWKSKPRQAVIVFITPALHKQICKAPGRLRKVFSDQKGNLHAKIKRFFPRHVGIHWSGIKLHVSVPSNLIPSDEPLTALALQWRHSFIHSFIQHIGWCLVCQAECQVWGMRCLNRTSLSGWHMDTYPQQHDESQNDTKWSAYGIPEEGVILAKATHIIWFEFSFQLPRSGPSESY